MHDHERLNFLELALRRSRRAFAWASIIGFLINLLVLTVPLYMMQIFDRVVISKSFSSLAYLTLIAVCALAVYGIFETLRGRILAKTSVWIENAVAPRLLRLSIEASLSGHPYKSEALRDLTTMRQFLGGGGMLALLDAPWAPLFLLLIFMLHPMLGILSIVGGVVLFVLAWFTERSSHADLRAANKLSVQSFRTADMAIRNAEVVEAMGMATAVIARWLSLSCQTTDLQSVASDRVAAIHSASKALRLILQIAVLGTGSFLVVAGDLSGGAMIAASTIMARALAPVEMAIGSWRQATSALDAYRRLQKFLTAVRPRRNSIELPRPQGLLTVENLGYTVPGMPRPIVSDVSFQLDPGVALGIIGPSAAGKSSLIRLLTGAMRPTRGSVRLDSAELWSWDRELVGQHVGYLPQDIELFDGTVADNIARLAAGDSRAIVAAAVAAGAHEMILRLPAGYETDIGETGVRLSGGQRQRIGLARALYGSPALVLLDEPNSNLDADGEQALNEGIRKMKESGATVVVVGHRPSIMVHMDRLLVMHDGRIQVYGSKKDVLDQLARQSIPPVQPIRARLQTPQSAS